MKRKDKMVIYRVVFIRALVSKERFEFTIRFLYLRLF